MKTTRWLWLALPLVFLAAAIPALISSLPALLEARLKSQLASHGVTDFTLGEPYWGLTGAGTRALTLAGSQGPWQYRIHLDQVQADYSWRTLVAGEVTAVSIASATVDARDSGGADEPAAPLDIADTLRTLAALKLPLDSLSLDELHLNLQLPQHTAVVTGEDLVADNSAQRLSGRLSLQLTGGDTALPPLRIDLEPGQQPWLPDLRLSLLQQETVAAAVELRLRPSAAAGRDRFPYRLQFALTVDDQPSVHFLAPLPAAALKTLLADTRLSLSATGELALPPQVERAEAHWYQSFPVDGTIQAGIRGDIAAYQLTDLDVQTGFTLAAGGGVLSLTPSEALQIQGKIAPPLLAPLSAEAGWSSTQPGLLTASAAPDFRLRYDSVQGRIEVDGPLELAATLAPEGAAPALTTQLALDNIQLPPGNASADLTATLRLPYRGRELPPVKITGAVAESPEAWTLTSNLAIDDWQLSGDAHIALAKAGATTVSSTLQLANLPTLLTALAKYQPLPLALSLAGGEAALDYQGRFAEGKTPRHNLSVKMTKLSGIAEGVAFNKASVSGSLALQQRWRTSTPIDIRIGELSAGVATTDVRLSAALLPSPALAQSTWRLDQAGGTLFGGQFQLAAPAEVDFPFAGNRITLVLSNLQLGDILALYQEQGVSGQGVLNGEIPLLLGQDGVRVAKGVLEGKPPGGRIALSSDSARAFGQSHQQLAMTLRLLEDFNYQVLKVTTDFLPSGDLTLAVTLHGSNPAEFDGRPVNFNINFEENVFQLFKVLKLTDEVTDKIERRLEKQKATTKELP